MASDFLKPKLSKCPAMRLNPGTLVNVKLLTLVWFSAIVLLFSGCDVKPKGATATFQFVPGPGADAEALLRSQLPTEDNSVTLLPIRNTELFSVVVTGEDPQKAADRANDLVEAMGKALRESDPASKFTVWETAAP